MTPFGKVALAVGGTALVLLAGCSGDEPRRTARAPRATAAPSPAPSATVAPSSAPSAAVSGSCSNEAEVASNALDRVSGPLIADVDGDATPERIYLSMDPKGPPGCQAFVVISADSTRSTAIADWDPAGALSAPSLNEVVQIDRRPGAEIVINLAAGASTQFVGVYSVFGGSFERLATQDRGDSGAAADLFAFGGSVGHLEAVDCTADGAVVLSSAIPKGARYQVDRRFYIANGPSLSLQVARNETEVVAAAGIDRFPEFAASPFRSCAAA